MAIEYRLVEDRYPYTSNKKQHHANEQKIFRYYTNRLTVVSQISIVLYYYRPSVYRITTNAQHCQMPYRIKLQNTQLSLEV